MRLQVEKLLIIFLTYKTKYSGTVGYSFGNLNIPGLELPWEDESFEYPTSISEPAKVNFNSSIFYNE